ncbi:MAG: AI-2E family transporter [Nitrospiraceae bacterium]
MSRRQLFATTFFLIFAVLLYELLRVVSPFVGPLVWAIILATATYPAYRRLRRCCGGQTTLAAVLMTVIVLCAVVLPAMYFVLVAGQQAMELYEQESTWLKNGNLHKLGEFLSGLPGIGTLSQEMAGHLIVEHGGKLESSLMTGGKMVSSFVMAQGADLAANAFFVVTDFVVMLFTLFFMFRDGKDWYGKLYKAIPMEADHKEKLFTRLNTTIKAVVRGTLFTAIAQGIVAGLGFWVLDVPFALFLGVLSGVLSFLPIGGTALVWGPVALFLLISGEVVKALILVGIGAGLVGFMDNLLQPVLVGSEAGLPVLPLFFASLGGMAAYGFLGLFLGPILLAVVMETFRIYQEEYQQEPGSDLVVPAAMMPDAELIAEKAMEHEASETLILRATA